MFPLYTQTTKPWKPYRDDDDDDDEDDEIAYFTVRWKTRELVLPKSWDNTDKDSKKRKRSH